MNNKLAWAVLSVISTSFISGCTTAVKDVTADRAGYLSRNFSPQSLSQEIRSKIPADKKNVNFGTLTITTEAVSEHSDGRKNTWKGVHSFTDAGNGLIESVTELSNNDVPFRLIYELTYHGLIDLKWQVVPLTQYWAGLVQEIKDITRFDPIPSGINQVFVVNRQSGNEQCKTTRLFAATEVHKKLPGKVMELECELRHYNTNVVAYRTKWALLEDYGVALVIERADSTAKATFRVIDVKN